MRRATRPFTHGRVPSRGSRHREPRRTVSLSEGSFKPGLAGTELTGVCSMTTASAPEAPFVDRRSSDPSAGGPGRERRQFTNSHEELSDEARELAQAIDGYKL